MSRLSRRKMLLGGGALALLGPGLRAAQAKAQPRHKVAVKKAPPPPPLTLVGATLHRAGLPPLAASVVRIEAGSIASVGTDKAAAKGSLVVDVRGKQISAGLVDLLTNVGAVEVSLEAATRDDRQHHSERRDADPIRAAFRTADGYNPASSLIAVSRMQGLTSVGVVPTDGLITGVSAWADLAGNTQQQALVLRAMALHINLNDPRHRGFEGNRASAWLALRETFDDAASYRKNKAGYERRQVRRLGASRLDLETLVLALEGRLPVVFHVDRASDIERALRLAKQLQLKAVLASAAEGWKMAKHIAAAKVPAIVYPLDDGPRSFSALGAREDNAARLHRAGVTVALSTGDTHNARKLRQVAGNAVRAGLPHAAALTAITETPARLFGLQQYGAVKAGRVANMVVWSGDPFELSTRVERLLIRGRVVMLRSRQTRLFERYR